MVNFREHALPNNFDELCKTTTRPTQLPVRRPDNQQFFRVHPKEDWQIRCAIFEDHAADSFDAKYFVGSNVYESDESFARVCYPVTLFFSQYRGGKFFLWPAKTPTGGQGDSWHTSALHIAKLATEEWVRMESVKGGNGYQETRPEGLIEEPEWPTEWTFDDALEIAFQGKVILDSEHDAVKRSRGII